MNHEEFMREALKEAKIAADNGDVPVGAVIVKNGEIIARGHNRQEQIKQNSSHAEMEAIQNACISLNDWRLDGCVMYVTLEPCPMCAGAILKSRLSHVYYGATDEKQGFFGGLYDLNNVQGFDHYPIVLSGILEEECKNILKDFFKNVRVNKSKYLDDIV